MCSPSPPLPPALAISFQAPWPMLFGPSTVDFDTGIFCGPQSIAKHVLLPFPHYGTRLCSVQWHARVVLGNRVFLTPHPGPEHCFSAPSNLPNKLKHLLIAPPALPPHCTGLAMLRLRTPAPARHRAPCRVSSSLTPLSCFFAFVNTQKSITCLDCRPHPPPGQGHGPRKETQETHLGTMFLLTPPSALLFVECGPSNVPHFPEVQTHAESVCVDPLRLLSLAEYAKSGFAGSIEFAQISEANPVLRA